MLPCLVLNIFSYAPHFLYSITSKKNKHIPYILQPSFSSFTLHTCIATLICTGSLVIAVAFTEKVTLYKFFMLL